MKNCIRWGKAILINLYEKIAFPMIHTKEMGGRSLRFKICNRVEMFRVRDWGGERDFTLNLVKSLRRDDVLFDIGASLGLISVLAASRLTSGKVISFEPDPDIANRLRQNYELNNLSNYDIIQVAIGEEKKMMKLYTEGTRGISPSLKQVASSNRCIEIDVDSLDNILNSTDIPRPTVVKIDVEGAEMMALHGMTHLLSESSKPRIIFLEIHPEFLPLFNTDINEVFHFLIKKNYRIKEITQTHNQILCHWISGN